MCGFDKYPKFNALLDKLKYVNYKAFKMSQNRI